MKAPPDFQDVACLLSCVMAAAERTELLFFCVSPSDERRPNGSEVEKEGGERESSPSSSLYVNTLTPNTLSHAHSFHYNLDCCLSSAW